MCKCVFPGSRIFFWGVNAGWHEDWFSGDEEMPVQGQELLRGASRWKGHEVIGRMRQVLYTAGRHRQDQGVSYWTRRTETQLLKVRNNLE